MLTEHFDTKNSDIQSSEKNVAGEVDLQWRCWLERVRGGGRGCAGVLVFRGVQGQGDGAGAGQGRGARVLARGRARA